MKAMPSNMYLSHSVPTMQAAGFCPFVAGFCPFEFETFQLTRGWNFSEYRFTYRPVISGNKDDVATDGV